MDAIAIHLSPAQLAAGFLDRFSQDYWRVERHEDGTADLWPCREDVAVAGLKGDDAWLDF